MFLIKQTFNISYKSTLPEFNMYAIIIFSEMVKQKRLQRGNKWKSQKDVKSGRKLNRFLRFVPFPPSFSTTTLFKSTHSYTWITMKNKEHLRLVFSVLDPLQSKWWFLSRITLMFSYVCNKHKIQKWNIKLILYWLLMYKLHLTRREFQYQTFF